jgi:choline dehydrogenase
VTGGGAPDVLVVGGGTSGCVLAARLSEDPARSVVLLEEGPDDTGYDRTVTSPAYAQSVSRAGKFAEGLRLDVDGAKVPLARGRVLGGTSAVNYLATVRGRPGDYDGWAAGGNPGWAWDDVLPAFRRAEHDLDFPDSPLHGDSGPLTVRRWSDATFAPAHAVFQHGLVEAGVPAVADLNDAGGLPGVGPFPASVDPATGARLTVSRAYLTAEVRRRPNLRVRTGVRVARLRLEGGRATGVITADGEVLTAAEIIVCCGAVQSPALLLRSGIGPAADLRAAGIEPVADRPGVGGNLQDHLGPGLPYRIRGGGVGTGGPAQTVWADPGVHVFPVLLPAADGTADETTFAVLVFSLRPGGSGRVTLHPDDPDRPPLIRLPFPDAREIQAQQRAFDVLDAWEHSTAAKEAGLSRLGDAGSLADPGAAAAASRAGLASYAHLTGSCAMGPGSDPSAVLDPACRVWGIEGLRVVDASSMPEIPAGNTYLTCVMMAERVAAMMTGDSG